MASCQFNFYLVVLLVNHVLERCAKLYLLYILHYISVEKLETLMHLNVQEEDYRERTLLRSSQNQTQIFKIGIQIRSR